MVLAELLGGGDAVEHGHLHVHDDEVGAQLGGQRHGRLAVAGLTDDIEAVVAEDLDDVEADQRFVFGHDDPSRGVRVRGGAQFLLSHL